MAIFEVFQDGGRPPSWIYDARVWTIDKGHLMSLSLCKTWVELMQQLR